jgi:hypothetical protein
MGFILRNKKFIEFKVRIRITKKSNVIITAPKNLIGEGCSLMILHFSPSVVRNAIFCTFVKKLVISRHRSAVKNIFITDRKPDKFVIFQDHNYLNSIHHRREKRP